MDNFPQYDANWLLTGQGNMLKNPPEIANLPVYKNSIDQLLSNENITIMMFAKKIGKEAQDVTDALNSKEDFLPAEFMKPILEQYPNYNPEWLATGIGEMVRSGLSIQPRKVGACEECVKKEEELGELRFKVKLLESEAKSLEEENKYLKKTIQDKEMIIELLKEKSS
ncbi:hypothetical protein V6R21_11575 [Limibacter armeniacum]|uniref:hypothetical protein n=1 Tax=Limibacter armeniacum TaxID=466084 RepID=UPI002FE6A364